MILVRNEGYALSPAGATVRMDGDGHEVGSVEAEGGCCSGLGLSQVKDLVGGYRRGRPAGAETYPWSTVTPPDMVVGIGRRGHRRWGQHGVAFAADPVGRRRRARP